MAESVGNQLFNGLKVGSIFSNNNVIGGASNGDKNLLGREALPKSVALLSVH